MAQKMAWPKPSPVEDPIACEFSIFECCAIADVVPAALPNSAGWGKSVGTGRIVNGRVPTPISAARTAKLGNLISLHSNPAFPLPTTSVVPISSAPVKIEKQKRKSVSGTAMARERSSDSTQSLSGSSGRTSPKKAALALPSIAAIQTVAETAAAVPPPPGLPFGSIVNTSTTLDTSLLAQFPDEPREGSISAESEAGPSSASPVPQTPAHYPHSIPPPPLTTDPIFVHSPYEEPRIFPFPTTDPGFAFILGLDEREIRRQREQAGGYQPSPFSKTLVGLAELGILSPELPDLIALQPNLLTSGFAGTFQPFDSVYDGGTKQGADLIAESSRATNLPKVEEPRNSSRFDFARNTVGQRQNPFPSMRRPIEDPSLPRDAWSGRKHFPDEPLRSQRTGENRAAALAAQVANFTSSYSSLGEHGWPGDFAIAPTRQVGSYGRDEPQDGRGMEQTGIGYAKGTRLERDDIDYGMVFLCPH